MTCNPLNLPIESYLFNLFFFITIFFHYHDLFSLTQSYFIITIFFITIFFNYHNLFQLSQSFSIITIFFHYHNLFQLSQSFLSQSFFLFFYNLYIENLFVRTYFCLWESFFFFFMISCKNLFFINLLQHFATTSEHKVKILKAITLTYFFVRAYLFSSFFYHSKSIFIYVHSFWSVRIENLLQHE